MSAHKNLKLMILVAVAQAEDHCCNYNVIISNPVDGKFDPSQSTYEMVANSYFEKERPNVILLYKTDDLINMEHIEVALKDGANLHCFRSGGGLRVARLEIEQELVGYGEHPNLLTALSHVGEDFKDGGLEYSEKYGENGKHTHYLTGTHDTDSWADGILLQGGTLDAEYKEIVLPGAPGGVRRLFKVHLKSTGRHRTPEEIVDDVIANGTVRTHTDRGYTYESKREHYPGGPSCTTSVIGMQYFLGTNYNASHYDVIQTGVGETFIEALINAENTMPLEVKLETEKI